LHYDEPDSSRIELEKTSCSSYSDPKKCRVCGDGELEKSVKWIGCDGNGTKKACEYWCRSHCLKLK
jgi:hypothetical protein